MTAAWNVISGADCDAVVLGVDFAASWRPEAGFADLAANAGPGYRFLQTVPPAVDPAQRPAGGAYVQGWLEEAERGQWQVAAVVGYCVGAVYAARIAEHVSRWQQPAPPLVLFDPLFTSIRSLAFEMHKALQSFATLLSAEETQQARTRVAQLAKSAHGDIMDLAAGLAGLYRETGAVAFERLGLDSTRSSEMISLFESYLSWLAVSAAIDPGRAWPHSAAAISTDYVTLSATEPSVQQASRLLGSKVLIEAAHNDLLRAEPAAKMLMAQLERFR